jgi:hypothetical protein
VTNRFDGESDVHFTPLSRDTEKHGVIVMFEVQQGKRKQEARTAKKTTVKNRKANNAKKKAKKKK